MTSTFKGRRGSYFFDILIFFVLLFLSAIVFIIVKIFTSGINHGLQESAGLPDGVKNAVNDFDTNYVKWADGGFLAIFVILCVALWFTSWIINTYPVFFVVSLLLMIVFTIVCALLKNSFFDMMNSAPLVEYSSQFTIIPFMMNNFAIIMLVVSGITAVLLYAKGRQSQ